MARYRTPWSRGLRVSTWLFALVLVGVLGVAAFVSAQAAAPLAVLPVAIGVAAIVLAWALAPRGFEIGGAALRVDRALLPVQIPLSSIRAAALLPGGLRGAVRLGGTSGAFGYYGRFWSRALGSFRLYATRTDGLVLVDTERERFVLSPEPPERFLEELLARAPRAAQVAPGAALGRRPVPRRWKLGVAVAVGAVLALLAGTFAASWGWAPVGASVEGGAVRVDRRWAGPVEIPLATIQAVSRVPPSGYRGWRRVAGTALGEVAYGRFRSDALGPFQLYAWRRGPCVLLETDEGRVVLTPEDPDGFVAAVREGIGR